MLFDLVRVVAVRHLHDHVLWLEFSDGVQGQVDLGHRLNGPLLEPLRDTVRFAQVQIEGTTIAWPGGVDWAPESLHDEVCATNGYTPHSNGDDVREVMPDVANMPEISRFFGVVIRMFYNDHARPHFHAEYAGNLLTVEIDGDGIRGRFPPHRLALLFEWRDLHRDELLANWDRLRTGEPVVPIAPLE